MFSFRKGTAATADAVPEKVRYTRYYEHDGQLRAYANRSMLMAGLFGVIAFISLLFAIYVRQPAKEVIETAVLHGHYDDVFDT